MRRLSSLFKARLILILVILTGYQMIFIQNVFSNGESIIVNDADDIFEIDQLVSNNLTGIASEVDDRIIINYADSVIDFDDIFSTNLDNKAEQVGDRIIVNYADAIIDFDPTYSTNLTNTANGIDNRIIIVYADSCRDSDLVEPSTLHQLFEGPSIFINTINGNYYNNPPIMDVDFVDITGLDDAYYKVDSYTPTGTDITGWTEIFSDFTGNSYTTNFTMDSSIWSALSEGSHIIYFKTWDDSGHIVDDSSNSLQFIKDTIGPTIQINTNDGQFYKEAPILNVDFFDNADLNAAYYKFDSYSPLGMDITGWLEIFSDYTGNYFTDDFEVNNTLWNSLDEGLHTIYFKAWDDLGNIFDGSSASLQLYKDLTSPVITINMINGSYYNSSPTMDIDFSDPAGLDDAYYKIDSFDPSGTDTTGWTEIFVNNASTSFDTNFTMDSSLWSSLSEGFHTVYFKVWDQLENIGEGPLFSWEFYKDTIAPMISIITPNNDFYISPPSFHVVFEDLNELDSSYYKIGSYLPVGLNISGWIEIFTNLFDYKYIANITISNAIWNSLEEGLYTVFFKSWDTTGNINDGSTPYWRFYKYSGIPIIIINTPEENYYNSSPIIDVDFFDPTGLNACYYQVDSYNPLGLDTTGWTNIVDDYGNTNYTTDFLLFSTIWNLLSEGMHTLYFKAFNYSGAYNDGSSPSLIFYKDTIPPNISLVSPIENGIYQSDVNVVLDISDHSKYYYKWDSETYIETSLTIFNLPYVDGIHDLNIKAVDEAGNIKTETFSFITDNTPPTALFQGINDEHHLYSLITIIVTPFDANGIKDVSFYLNSQLLSRQVSDYTYKFNPPMYEYGTYIFTIKIEDLAGNILTRDFTIFLDPPPPDFWQTLFEQGILIPLIAGIIGGVVSLLFLLIRRKLKS